MRPCRPLAIAAALGLGLVATPSSDADDTLLEQATRLMGIRVTKFLVGHLEAGTNEFVACDGRDAEGVFRDSVFLIEFSAPIDFEPERRFDPLSGLVHVNPQTIRVGVDAGDFLPTPIDAAYFQHRVARFNPVSGAHELIRRYRNRVIVDPGMHRYPPPGLEPDTLYRVIVHGVGARDGPTVRSRRGRPVVRAFETTFRTKDAFRLDYVQPRVVGMEATDAPGTQLFGRTDVALDAGIVVRFSEPMLESSFGLGGNFQVADTTRGQLVPGTLTFSGRNCEFRPIAGSLPESAQIQVSLDRGLRDLAGNEFANGPILFTFRTAAAPATP